MTSAGHLIRCVHSFAVGVEQQLHHIERCALGGGVVQGQPFVLRTRREAQHSGVAGRLEEDEWSKGEKQRHAVLGHSAWAVKYFHRAARLISCGGGLAFGLEQQFHHIKRRPLVGSVVQGHPIVLRVARRAAQH